MPHDLEDAPADHHEVQDEVRRADPDGDADRLAHVRLIEEPRVAADGDRDTRLPKRRLDDRHLRAEPDEDGDALRLHAGVELRADRCGDGLRLGSVGVVDMDDGDRTGFRWLARGPTGLASASRSPSYHGPGPGAGNSIAVLLNGFLLSGERALFDKAGALIRRCISP